MLRVTLILAFVFAVLPVPQGRAKNVILFLADAGGIPTINAASLHGYGAPRKLYIQRMPNIGLSDTSPVGSFVTDSAAGMTAIVTGQKTRNGVVSQSALAERKVLDGAPLKSILEYAEEKGLATGIITNDSLTGATPAALYAKVNDRGMTAAIFRQAFAPRFGDGPDVMIGAGRPSIAKALVAVGLDIDELGKQQGRPVLRTLAQMSESQRPLVVLESADYDLQQAMQSTLRVLSQNPRGYFLMVEWDSHTDNVRRGLNRLVALDKVIESTAATVGPDTLLLFTADHSFDFRLLGGDSSQPLLTGLEQAEEQSEIEDRSDVRTRAIHVGSEHTGEEVLVAAAGPGSERVRGYLANSDLFRIMMDAFGWTAN